MALLATMSIALRNVMEEIIFANCKNIDPLLFSASYGLFGTGLIGAMLLVAQVLPGPDNGVQALIDSFRIYPRCAIELLRSSLILTSSHPPRSSLLYLSVSVCLKHVIHPQLPSLPFSPPSCHPALTCPPLGGRSAMLSHLPSLPSLALR